MHVSFANGTSCCLSADSGRKHAIGLPPCIWTLGAPATILSWSSADSTIESRYCFEFAFSDLTSNSGCSDRSGVKYLE